MSAESVAREFVAALNEQRFHDAVALCDPASLNRFRDGELATLVAHAENREAMAKSPEVMFGYSMGGPLVNEQLAKHAHVRLLAAPGTPAIGELAALSPAEFAVFCIGLGGSSPRINADGIEERGHLRIVGVVTEDGVVAHVPFRYEGGGFEYGDDDYVEKMRIRHSASGWLVDFDSCHPGSILAMPLAFLFGDFPGENDLTPYFEDPPKSH